MLHDWQDQRHIATIGEKRLFITLQNERREIVRRGTSKLCSNQEQAVTKIFLAAKFIGGRGCNKLSIQTVNNNVAALALYYALMLSKLLYSKIGALKNERILSTTDTSSEKKFHTWLAHLLRM